MMKVKKIRETIKRLQDQRQEYVRDNNYVKATTLMEKILILEAVLNDEDIV